MPLFVRLFGNLSLVAVVCAVPAEAAAQRKVPAKEVTNGIGMRLIFIAPGKFLMGSTAEEIALAKRESKNNWYDNEGPRHEVEITKPFFMGVYEVTQDEFKTVRARGKP